MTAPSDHGPPDFAALIDWLEGRLAVDAAARVADAVAAGDARTQGRVEWLRGFLVVAESFSLHEPPPLVRQRLRSHFARWAMARETLNQSPVEVSASLLFDSRKDLALTGMRAADELDDAVHLAYTTDRADLVVDVRSLGSGHVRIDGQVLVADPSAAVVFEAIALGPGISVRTVDGDELGRFSLASVPDHANELRVTNGELVIVAALDLRGEEPRP